MGGGGRLSRSNVSADRRTVPRLKSHKFRSGGWTSRGSGRSPRRRDARPPLSDTLRNRQQSTLTRQLRDNEDMTTERSKVELSAHDLRVVARYAAESARESLSIFEETYPGDRRPRLAVEAAWTFAEGAKRTKVQRTSALAAHKAAREATNEAAQQAAHAAGAAAAAAYLHPLAKSTQIRHILGAAAHAARAAELAAGGDQSVGAQRIEQARQRATPALVAVLRRYPAAPSTGTRVAQLMRALDTSLRSLYGGRNRSRNGS